MTSEDPENIAKRKRRRMITQSSGALVKKKKPSAAPHPITVFTNIVHFLVWTQLEMTDMKGDPIVHASEVIEMKCDAFFCEKLRPFFKYVAPHVDETLEYCDGVKNFQTAIIQKSLKVIAIFKFLKRMVNLSVFK